MTLLSAVPSALALCFVLLSLRGYLRSPLRWRTRLALLGIRLAILVLLLAAYYRPSLSFRRVAPTRTGMAVLLDNSLSMRAFLDDSLRAQLHQTLQGLPGEHTRTYLFGDSLRPSAAEPSFADTRSYLQRSAVRELLSRARSAVIISDGSWSNATSPLDAFIGTEACYLSLPTPRLQPSLQVSVLQQRIESTVGVDTAVQVVIDGVAGDSTQVAVSAFRGSTRIAGRTRTVVAGPFRDTLRLPLRGTRPGARLCRVVAAMGPVESSADLVHTVLPQTIHYHVHVGAPRLDSRFALLALQQTPGLEPADGPGKADLCVILDWDSTAASLIDGLSRRGVALLLGCVPCDDAAAISMPGGRLVQSDRASVGQPPLADVPAPLRVLSCPSPRATGRALLSLVSDAGSSAPVLQHATVRGKTLMIAGVRGFWRWDFSTRLLADEGTPPFPFSRFAIQAARQALVARLSDAFLAYPFSSPLTENVPAHLVLSIPPSLDLSRPGTLRLALQSSADTTAIDTVVAIDDVDARSQVHVFLPPLSRGRYAFSAQLTHPDMTRTHHDTLMVESDRSEATVGGQNSQFLGQVARRVSLEELSTLGSTPEEPVSERTTVASSVRVRLSWQLLAALLVLVALEWAVRRRLRLD